MYLMFLYAMPLLAIMNLILLKSNSKNMFNVSLLWSLLYMFYFMLILMVISKSWNFQFNKMMNWFSINFNMFNWTNSIFGLDGISLYFIGLTAILIPISMLMSSSSMKTFKKEFNILMHLCALLLMLFFSSLNLMNFYIFFEATLIPMFILMGIWGYSEEKMKAAFYFFFYTLMGSMLMLLSMIKIYVITGFNNYENLLTINFPDKIQNWLFMGLFLGLAVKMPMIPFHIWLPQAHVEAPMAGSMLLAGMLLKLGGYGLISLCYPLLPMAFNFYNPFIMLMSVMAMVYGAFTTCRQMDLKRLIAYSSISHMGLMTLGMFSNSIEGTMGALLMMMAHGLSSSGMFIVSSMIYSSFHSSIMKYFKGLTVTMPMLSVLSFLMILANMSFPFTFNFMAELFLIMSIIKYSFMLVVMMSMGMFINLIYSLYIYNSMFFGYISSYLKYTSDLKNFEFQSLLIMAMLMFFLGINPNLIMNMMIFSSYIQISY